MESFRASKAPSTDFLHIFPSLWKCELIGQNRLIGTSHEVIPQPEEMWATESVKTTMIRAAFWLSQDVLLPSFGLHQLTSTADADYWATVNSRVDPVHSLPIARGIRIHLNKSPPAIPGFRELWDCGVKQAPATANENVLSSGHARIIHGYGRLTTPQLTQTA
jgi:hypothetical protein